MIWSYFSWSSHIAQTSHSFHSFHLKDPGQLFLSCFHMATFAILDMGRSWGILTSKIPLNGCELHEKDLTVNFEIQFLHLHLLGACVRSFSSNSACKERFSWRNPNSRKPQQLMVVIHLARVELGPLCNRKEEWRTFKQLLPFFTPFSHAADDASNNRKKNSWNKHHAFIAFMLKFQLLFHLIGWRSSWLCNLFCKAL